jgi:methionyl aminopeptidase
VRGRARRGRGGLPGVTTAERTRSPSGAAAARRPRRSWVRWGGAPPYRPCSALVNAVVVHGIPDRRQVRGGDVVGMLRLLLTATARTRPARRGRNRQRAGPRAHLGHRNASSVRLARAFGRAPPPGRRDSGRRSWLLDRPRFVGHGIGRAMHEPPSVPNYGREGSGLAALARDGCDRAHAERRRRPRSLLDGWTVVTGDASLSAHVEHGSGDRRRAAGAHRRLTGVSDSALRFGRSSSWKSPRILVPRSTAGLP